MLQDLGQVLHRNADFSDCLLVPENSPHTFLRYCTIPRVDYTVGMFALHSLLCIDGVLNVKNYVSLHHPELWQGKTITDYSKHVESHMPVN